MSRDLKPGGRAERLARLEWEVSELRHSLSSLRWMVGATLFAVLLPLLFSVPPLSWLANAVRGAFEVFFWFAAIAGLVIGGFFLWKNLRRKREPVERSNESS